MKRSGLQAGHARLPSQFVAGIVGALIEPPLPFVGPNGVRAGGPPDVKRPDAVRPYEANSQSCQPALHPAHRSRESCIQVDATGGDEGWKER